MLLTVLFCGYCPKVVSSRKLAPMARGTVSKHRAMSYWCIEEMAARKRLILPGKRRLTLGRDAPSGEFILRFRRSSDMARA